jgi:hypothetical protein
MSCAIAVTGLRKSFGHSWMWARWAFNRDPG